MTPSRCGSKCAYTYRPRSGTLPATISKPSKAAEAGTLKSCEEGLHTTLVDCKGSCFSKKFCSHRWRLSVRAQPAVHAVSCLIHMCMNVPGFVVMCVLLMPHTKECAHSTQKVVLISVAQHSPLFCMPVTCNLSSKSCLFRMKLHCQQQQ